MEDHRRATTGCHRRASWAGRRQGSCRPRGTPRHGRWARVGLHLDSRHPGECPHLSRRFANGLSTPLPMAKSTTTTGKSIFKKTCEIKSSPKYFFSRSGESIWEKPKELIDFEKRQGGVSAPAPVQAPAKTASGDRGDDDPIKAAVEEAKKQAELHKPKPSMPASSSSSSSAPQDKSRPVSSTPVPGTPWCVVWTGDNR